MADSFGYLFGASAEFEMEDELIWDDSDGSATTNTSIVSEPEGKSDFDELTSSF